MRMLGGEITGHIVITIDNHEPLKKNGSLVSYNHKSVVCILQGSKDTLFKESYTLINCKPITF